MRCCTHKNFCSGSIWRCLTIPPIVQILLPATTIVPAPERSDRDEDVQAAVTGRAQAGDCLDTGVRKLVSMMIRPSVSVVLVLSVSVNVSRLFNGRLEEDPPISGRLLLEDCLKIMKLVASQIVSFSRRRVELFFV
ncbi:hypothetical protein AVEN_172085-1 [Araneus ventricosus]|uniref:Uncharacterized protein n=1 Tax=Araneus ventricosus TaxID=182803 RepID=A0A4Y2M212_ARAVE|nr:hypothetical protein AVEN_172085-1 [Araneus ventricosus]